ncbi:MAG: HlyD family efflux transporter periplasmic adaptor subunit, partial [Patescibacteria group bacterium]
MKKSVKIIIPVVVVLIIIGMFFIFGNKNKKITNDYKTTKAEMGNFVDYIEADGKISGQNQISIKSKVTGNVEEIYFKNGNKIKKGDLIMKLDTTDIENTVQNARIGVSNAQNNLNRVTKPVDKLSLTQAKLSLETAKDNLDKLKLSQEITLAQAKEANDNAKVSLDNAYDSALNNIDSAFAGYATIINNSQKVLYLSDLIVNQDITGTDADKNLLPDTSTIWNVEIPKYWKDIIDGSNFDTPEDKAKLETLAKTATANYKNAKSNYSLNVSTYRTLSRFSSKEDIEKFLNTSIDTAKNFTEMERSLNNLYDFWVTYNNDRKRTLYYNIPAYNLTLKTDTVSANNYLSNLISSQTGAYGIDTLKTSLKNSERNLQTLTNNQPLDLKSAQINLDAAQESYNKIVNGADKLDIKTYQIALEQANNQLNSAIEQLNNYYIKAPFDGVVGGILVKPSDLVAAGTSVAQIVSNEKIVEINVNENDTSKLQIGQKTTVTFDAFENFKIDGEVIEINTTPNNDQSNVVNYLVKISLNTPKEDSDNYKNFNLIRTGMNVSAKIITKEKNNILLLD